MVREKRKESKPHAQSKGSVATVHDGKEVECSFTNCNHRSALSYLSHVVLLSYYQRGKRDFSNFDTDFISEKPRLTVVEREVVEHINQSEFDNFTYTNADFTA